MPRRVVPGESGSLSIQTKLHSTKWWLIIPVEVGGRMTIEMVLDTGSPLSSISERLCGPLLSMGLLEPVSVRSFVLHGLKIQNQPIRDLRVRVSRRVTRTGADGVFGLDFLARYSTVHFDVSTLRLTLTYP
jgi:hypothetical protein